MTEQAVTQLQKQIDAIRRQAFAAGYAAAMKKIEELALSAPQWRGKVVVPNGVEKGEGEAKQPQPSQAAIPLSTRNPVRRLPAKRRAARRAANERHGSRRGRAKRGVNAGMIQEILQKAAPRAIRQADIRRALEQRGVSLPYPSIGHALGQLKARKAAKQVGKSGTWRYSAAA